jgi:hypothetical protein
MNKKNTLTPCAGVRVGLKGKQESILPKDNTKKGKEL